MKTKNKKKFRGKLLLAVTFLVVMSGASFVWAATYDPISPPPPSHIRYIPPSSSSTQIIPPPPGGWSRPSLNPYIPPPTIPSRNIFGGSDYDKSSNETVDFALTAVSNPALTKQDELEGIFVPFTLRNYASKKYGVQMELVCSDFQAQATVLAKPGLSRHIIFHPLQESSNGRYEGASDFRAGKKTERCSLNIAHIQHDDFSDYEGPADENISNNSFSFLLTFENRKPAIKNAKPETNNISERVKKLRSPLFDEELKTYKNLSKKKCLNVLISSADRGSYYNGEPLDPKDETVFGPWIKIYNAHIAGDRLGYVKQNEVVVDGEEVGTINEVDFGGTGPENQLHLNEKHYAYARKVEYDAKNFFSKYHLIFDGKDLGETGTMGVKLNGDYIIYQNSTFTVNRFGGRENIKNYVYANDKKLGEGSFADYDGENLIFYDAEKGFVLNGKKLGFGGNGVLKDGHVAYILGKTENVIDPHVFLDGKDLGRGREPVIEKNHIAFIRARSEIDPNSNDQHPKVIYNGKELGYVGGRWKIDLAGNHVAYIRKLEARENPFEYPEDFARISIDGKDYPGDFLSGVYVEIEEKKDRSEC